MEDRPAKKRKVRKGTRSCWQCRKRKIRCEFAPGDDETCAGCKARGAHCVSQEFVDHEPVGQQDRGLSQRLGRLEELMVKLADKIGPRTSAEATSMPSPDAEADVVPDAALRRSGPLRVGGSPARAPAAENAASAGAARAPLGPSRSPSTQPCDITPKHDKICRQLHSMFPSSHDAKVIVESSKGPVFALILFYSYEDILRGKSPPTASLSVMPCMSKHPAVLAKHLLLLAICLQQLPPGFDASLLNFGLSIQDTMAEWVATASLVTSNDEMVGSAEGLECLILQGFYLVNSGNLRKAWLAMRRALSLAQLMGIEQNAHRTLRSCDPAVDPAVIPSPHQLWYRINFCDRYLSLLLGLPAGTHDNSFADDSFIARDTPMESLEKRHTVISLRIIDRNHASASEAYAMTQSIDCELEAAAKTMGAGWWDVPPAPIYSDDVTTQMSVMSHIMLQIHHHSLLILLHLPYMLRNQMSSRFDYSKNTCLESSRAVLRRCVIFRTANNAAFSCRHIDYSSLVAAMTLLLGQLSRPSGVRDEEWSSQRIEDRALAETVLAKMEELAVLNDDKLSGESAGIIKQLLPIIDCCNDCLAGQSDGSWNVRLSIPYLGTINITTSSNQNAQSHSVNLSHSQLPTPTNTTTVSPASFSPHHKTPPVASVDSLLDEAGSAALGQYICAGFSSDCFEWQCPGITAEADDWAFQGVDTTYWSLLNSGMTDDSAR
ncbi:C6 zinc finger domain-containing protein [Colletotrichum plurivorum]|uniref:C6 zinc finger domain-containing protein n=1 Tax=Colletotrichum plurivorum TaxID=2175906 RepID=A0A8H6JSV8_9PEZI|nr:C6 zinc finger domain-containing protein [Colletotrichum plurivorum]